jgi:hypothetical protein
MSLGRAAARLDSANRGNVIVVDFRRHRPPTDSPGTAIDPCPIPPGFVPTQHALHHGCRSARDPIATEVLLGRASASAWAVLVAGAPTRAPTESVGRFRGGRQAGGALEQSGRLRRREPVRQLRWYRATGSSTPVVDPTEPCIGTRGSCHCSSTSSSARTCPGRGVMSQL